MTIISALNKRAKSLKKIVLSDSQLWDAWGFAITGEWKTNDTLEG